MYTFETQCFRCALA